MITLKFNKTLGDIVVIDWDTLMLGMLEKGGSKESVKYLKDMLKNGFMQSGQ